MGRVKDPNFPECRVYSESVSRTTVTVEEPGGLLVLACVYCIACGLAVPIYGICKLLGIF